MTRQEDEEQLRRDYNEVFNTEAGKRVLADLLTVTYILQPTVEFEHGALAAQAGARNVGIHITTRLRYTSADFTRLEGNINE